MMPIDFFYIHFESEVERLFSLIEKKKLERRNEYIHLGKKAPARIKFEDLDLKEYKYDMLAILKILHNRLHWNNLTRDLRLKAITVGIAGICELIKDELRDSFWDLYFMHIERRGDNHVYNEILEPGFRENGIKLLRSKGVGNREFVDSLIAESGIPTYKAKDQVDFFILFWRYFQNEKDIENLIRLIISNQHNMVHVPHAEQRRLYEISYGIKEYISSFALVIEKLVKIFRALETLDILNENDLRNALNKVHSDTGIDPFTVVSNEEQLYRIYNRITKLLTPGSFFRLLTKLPGSTIISLPDETQTRKDQYYFRNILYGKHRIQGIEYYCVPDKSYTIEDLVQLKDDKIQRTVNKIVLKSYSSIEIKINGKLRDDLVRKFYIGKNFTGNILFSEIPVASIIKVRTKNNKVNETIRQEDEFLISPIIRCRNNADKPSLYLFISSVRVVSYNLRNQQVSLKLGKLQNPLATLNLDEYGCCNLRDFSYEIRETTFGELPVYIVSENSEKVLNIKSQNAESRVSIDKVMLFSIKSYRITPVDPWSSPIKFGDNRFILFAAKNIKREHLILTNLKVIKEIQDPIFRILYLKWSRRDSQAQIKAPNFYWNFEQVFSPGMRLRKSKSHSEGYQQLNELQGLSLTDFELTLYPVPPEKIEEDLFWNIAINDKEPYKKSYLEGPKGKKENLRIIFAGEELKEIVFPFWDESIDENACIELSLCTFDQELCSVKFWVLSSLRIEHREFFKNNERVVIRIAEDRNNDAEDLILKDLRGNSIIKLTGTYSEQGFIPAYKEFRGEFELKTIRTVVELKFRPKIEGIFLYNKVNCELITETEILSILDVDKTAMLIANRPVGNIYINDKLCLVDRILNEGISEISLSQLKGELKYYTNILKINSGQDSLEINISFDFIDIGNIDIKDHFINNHICGEMNVYGPADSFIRFDVFFPAMDKYSSKKSFKINCTGDYEYKFPFSFQIDCEEMFLYGQCEIKIYKMLNGKESELEESWHVIYDKQNQGNDSELISLIQALEENGKLFKAYELARTILSNSVVLSPAELIPTINEIKRKLILKSMNSVVQQVSQILEEEYNLKF